MSRVKETSVHRGAALRRRTACFGFCLVVVCAAIGLNGPAVGQDAQQPTGVGGPKPGDAPINDWTKVETVVVTAPVPGPAMWHIVKGNSEVWVIPTVAPAPKSLDWDSRAVLRVMKGARAVLLAPTADANVFDLSWFLIAHGGSLRQPDGATLEGTLPQPLRARFIAQRTALNEDADKYKNWIAPVAALTLLGDFREKDGLTGDLETDLRRLARRSGVSVKPITSLPVMDALREIPTMSATAQQACLSAVIDEIEIERAHAVAAAQAWAIGSISDIKANASPGQADDCLNGGAHLAQLRGQYIDAYTNVIGDALTQPGKTVVVMPIVVFLRQQSVLDRLVAAGATVTGPAN